MTQMTETSSATANAASEETVIITDEAAAKIRELMDEEGDTNLKLRIYITGGGCSGFKYNFSFDSDIADDDTVVSKKVPTSTGGYAGEVHLLIDSMSLPYLQGATIDYKNDLEGERFVVRNPNAKGTCGCGSSFDA